MLTGVFAGLAAGALWGLVFVAPRMAPGYSSVDVTAGRFAAYGLVAAVVMLLTWRSRRLPTVRQALAALAMSVLGFSGYYLLLVLAIRDAGTEVPTLIIGTIPIWVMLLGKPLQARPSAAELHFASCSPWNRVDMQPGEAPRPCGGPRPTLHGLAPVSRREQSS